MRDLATHSGGFDNSKPYMTPDAKKMFEELFRKRPVRPRGERFEYACSNFVYLGLIVERLTGLDLDAASSTPGRANMASRHGGAREKLGREVRCGGACHRNTAHSTSAGPGNPPLPDRRA